MYAKNFDAVKRVVTELDPEEAVVIETGQEKKFLKNFFYFLNKPLKLDHTFINSNLVFLLVYLKKLEESGQTLESVPT